MQTLTSVRTVHCLRIIQLRNTSVRSAALREMPKIINAISLNANETNVFATKRTKSSGLDPTHIRMDRTDPILMHARSRQLLLIKSLLNKDLINDTGRLYIGEELP